MLSIFKFKVLTIEATLISISSKQALSPHHFEKTVSSAAFKTVCAFSGKIVI